MEWIRPADKLPPQGKKVLYLQKGDVYVVQRWGEYWLPIPFYDSKYAFHDKPELWADINLPDGLTGKVHVKIEGNMCDIDELQEKHPNEYKEFLRSQLKVWEIVL